MKTFDGYKKRSLDLENILLANGGDKSLSDFVGSLNWDSTNRKLQYKAPNASSYTDLITFETGAFATIANYLPLSGGTMVGPLTLKSTRLVNLGTAADNSIITRGIDGLRMNETDSTKYTLENLYLNLTSTGNVLLCGGGGNVGINNNTPTYKLSVSGTTYVESTARETLILKKTSTGGPMLTLQTSDGVEVANLSSSADSIQLFNYSGYRKDSKQITSIGVSTDGYAFAGSGGTIETKYKLLHEGNYTSYAYKLVNFAKTDGSKDCNNLVESGFYNFNYDFNSSSNTLSNKPGTAIDGGCALLVIRHGGYSHQLFFGYNDNRLYSRSLVYSNGTKWNGWSSIALSGEAQPANGGNSDTLDGVHATDLHNWVLGANMTYAPATRTFTNTRATNSWDTLFYSNICFKDNCYISFRVVGTNAYRMIGLNTDPTTNATYTSIDYCWYPQNGGGLQMYENGSAITSISGHTTYADGDEFRIEYLNGYIKYYHNGTCCRTVSRAIGSPLYADCSFYNGGSIRDVQFGAISYDTSLLGGLSKAYYVRGDLNSITPNNLAKNYPSYIGMIYDSTAANWGDSGGWHTVWLANFNNNTSSGSSGNFHCSQIANKIGSNALYVRSRAGGDDIATGWTSWLRIALTGESLPANGGTSNYAKYAVESPTEDAKSFADWSAVLAHKSFVGMTTVGGTWYHLIKSSHRTGTNSDGMNYGMVIYTTGTSRGNLVWDAHINSRSWNGARTIIDSSNIGSLSVNYANYAGYLSGGNTQLSAASESNEVYIYDYGNSSVGNVLSTGTALAGLRKAIRFRWYNTYWSMGTMRGGGTDSTGMGWSYNTSATACSLKMRLDNSGNLYVASNFYASSDIRLKDITEMLNISYIDLATLPLFNFKWKNDEHSLILTGTSALEVQKILPNLVHGDENLTLSYSTLGVVSGITACKELVNTNQRIEQLEEKVKQLTLKLLKYENI